MKNQTEVTNKAINQTECKKEQIKQLVLDMLNESHEAMKKRIDTVLNSGAINIDKWEKDTAPMILPKCILTAILEHQSTQYDGKGTSYQKQIKKEIKNIRYFL